MSIRLALSLLLCLLLSACGLDDLRQLLAPAEQAAVPGVPANLPHTPATFDLAKKKLYNDVYQGHAKTFYCGCDFDPRSRRVMPESCGFLPRKNPERASRIEAEHVMPAHQFGNFRECWRHPETVCGGKMSGRKCCEEKDPVFTTAHNDLNNLYPAIGEVNGDRSNFNWGEIPGEKREYGACPMEIDESIRRAEPPEAVKGDIARTMFYMEKTYGFRLSDQDRKLYNAWNRMDPPDDWEQERNRRIARIQGQDNPFISRYGVPPENIRAASDRTESKPVKAPPETPASSPASDTVREQPDRDIPVPAEKERFSCQPLKSCSKMASCEEALFQLQECGNKSIDGNDDGIPCASLCRR
ncbi:MAG TPA: endonuclease [Fluviicoccus sp.]|nr:endonuclease [Fluviicoccus sp.]